MGGIGAGDNGRDERELSWTNEALPLEVRRALLDKALEDFRKAKAAGGGARAGTAARRDRADSGRGPDEKDKPQA